MYKRMIALLLCLCMCLAFVPVDASAAMTNEQYRERYRIMRQIKDMYKKILERCERESMKGLCGAMVSWELYFLDINEEIVGYNGNEYFDRYVDMKETSGGFPVQAYPASDYTLEEALYTISKGGTEDVYNIMVGFDWTSTEAGNIFGHVCMIHAIIDGYVYFMEGFDIYNYPEGEAAVMEITSFANYWSTWTKYEGTIYFGNKQTEDFARYYGTDMYIQTQEELDVTKDPGAEAQVLRTTATGERLHAVGVYQDQSDDWYYKVEENNGYAFVPAAGTQSIWMGFDDVRTTKLKLPKSVQVGGKFTLTGKLRIPLLELESVWITVTDQDGKILKDQTIDKNGKYCNFGEEEIVVLKELPEGCYYYNVYADLRNHYVSEGAIQYKSKTVLVQQQMFTVGKAKLVEVTPPAVEETVLSGWVLEDDVWYYFEDGQPCPGWLCSGGVNYYIQENGAVTTGWAEINGVQRFFSDTGALLTGWVSSGKETYYLLRNGVRSTGWQNIDGGRYYLGSNGVLRKKGWLWQDGKLYYVDENGRACVDWVDLKEGRFCFHADGYVISRMIGEEVVEYDGKWKPYLLLK